MTTVETPSETDLAAQRAAGRGPAAGAPDPLEGLDLARLRTLEQPELDELAARIRTFLVESVALTGGHLGSNLGVVELTLALHRVVDSPDDAIVWDTGHQAYVHKLLTGRAGAFDRLRQAGGLSGYPNRSESEHDLVENSHASTGTFLRVRPRPRPTQLGGERTVVAVVGDGALTGGLAYEALNNIGAVGTDVVIVLNDNGRSYAPTVSRLTMASDGPSGEPAPRFLRGAGGALPRPGRRSRCGSDRGGPPAGSSRGRTGGRPCADGQGPRLPAGGAGRGEVSARRRPFRSGHRRRPSEGQRDPSCSYTKAFGEALVAEATRRPEVVAVTAAMPGPTGLLDFRGRFPARLVDVGIAEQHAVAAAAGMAMGGLRPVVAVYSTFLNRAWDQIYCDVGLHGLPVVFCIDRAGITGEDGPSHHGLLDLALLTKVPGMTVLVPSNCDEVGVMLHQALEITAGPVAIRWPKTPGVSGATGSGLRARRVRTGRDVCLLGVGKLVEACENAASLLAARGIDATVWDVRVASPLDPVMIDDAMQHPRRPDRRGRHRRGRRRVQGGGGDRSTRHGGGRPGAGPVWRTDPLPAPWSGRRASGRPRPRRARPLPKRHRRAAPVLSGVTRCPW